MFPICSNPLKKKPHKKVVREKLRLVSNSISKVYSVNLRSYICDTCRLEVQKSLHDSTPDLTNNISHDKMEIEEMRCDEFKELNENENDNLRNLEDQDNREESILKLNEIDEFEELNGNDDLHNLEDQANREESILKLNNILSILQLSSIKLSSDLRTKNGQLKKINEIKMTLDALLESVFKFMEPNKYQNDVEELIKEIQEKLNNKPKNSEAVKLLTMVPKSWEICKIKRIFDVPYSLARKAVNLHVNCGIGSSPNPRPGKTLPEETVRLVRDFYYDCEISRQLPGKKDCVSLKIDGSRKLIQKRLILGNLKELYACFKAKNPEIKLGFSTFAVLRPKECVFAGGCGTHSICVCKNHENTKLLIDGAGLVKLIANDEKLQFLGSYKTMLSKMVCDPNTPSCFLGLCKSCPGVNSVTANVSKLLETNFIEAITYNKWISTDRTSLETVTVSSEKYLEELSGHLVDLLKHDFIAKSQSKFLRESKQNLKEGEFIILFDFAQNYETVIQNAVQSEFWNKKQITIHPTVVYYKEDGKNQCESYAIISEDLDHNTSAVHLFMEKIIADLKKNHHNVKKILYFTDGAAAQYKNKSNFINLLYHQHDFGCEAHWHFFATSHGKSPCDGIGGKVKREAGRASLQRPSDKQILTAEDFYKWGIDAFENIKFMFCSQKEHDKKARGLKSRFNKASTIPGTRSFHSFILIGNQTIQCRNYSAAEETFEFQVQVSSKRKR